MPATTFEIAVNGALVPGADPLQTRQRVALMFKTDVARVEPLFSGKRFVVKRGIDEQTAIKYQAALRQAGVIAEVMASAPAEDPPGAATAAESASIASATIAPPGSILVEPERVVPPQVDISHLSMDAPGVILVEPEKVVAPRFDLSRLSVAERGATLVAPTEVPPLQVDLSGMTLAEPGVTLIEPEKVAEPRIELGDLRLA